MRAIKSGKFSMSTHAGKAKGGSDMGTRFSGLAGRAMKDNMSGKPSWVSPAAWAKRSKKS